MQRLGVCGNVLAGILFSVTACVVACAGDSINEPQGSPGRKPRAADGRELNFDFETGDLTDWKARGRAFEGQPIKGDIDQKRVYGQGRHSLHTGDYWIGGFEKLQDAPTGTLTSVEFKVDAPYASFLLGGGNHAGTRVELIRSDTKLVFFSVSGANQEEMRPVIVDLKDVQGRPITIRIVDEHTGGWGHVNFDDFRFHDEKPKFQQTPLPPRADYVSTELYPYENLTGAKAAEVMQVPPGFSVQCAAEEPDVRQPIAMAIDDRGRVWVAEAYCYPSRAAQGKGTDRILIFEDTNQDGVLDKRTVFLENLNLVSGIEVGFGGVFIGAAPYLLFVPDRNQNDIPDGLEDGAQAAASPTNVQFPLDVPPGAEVLLDGWAWEDTHETLNAFTWGPDGWLYGCHGVFTHSRVGKPGASNAERQPLNAAIWRWHPLRKTFEIFAEGTSNPWGVDFDKYGEAFCTACVIPHLYHIIPGGHYQRQAGQHFNPYVYQDLMTIARHRHFVGNQWNNADRRASDDAGGGHAHAGAMIYQGGAWPEQYNGKLFMHNIHGNRVNVDVLIPEGSGYAGDRQPDFLLTGDKWSQMINLQYGPDGQVWMIDWYDQFQCHHKSDEVHDRGNGRIFRVAYQNAKPVQVNLQQADRDQLVQHALFARNEWFARHARRRLQELSQEQKFNWASLWDTPGLNDKDPVQTLRFMWMLHSVGVFASGDRAQLAKLAQHESPHVRGWTFRLLAENADDSLELLKPWLASAAKDDPSPVARLAVASALQKLPAEDRWSAIEGLVSHREDKADHNLPAMIWFAMEPLAEVDPQRALALGLAAGDTIPLLRDLMIRRLGSGEPGEAVKLLVEGLKSAADDETRLTFLKGIRGSLTGLREIAAPGAWTSAAAPLLNPDTTARNFDVYLHALGLSARFGEEPSAQKLREIAVDEAGPPDARRLALSFLIERRDGQLPDMVGKLLQGSALRSDALRAVALVEDGSLAEAVVATYSSLDSRERAQARGALASRPQSAVTLLEAVRQNRIAKSDLSADLVRQLRNLNDDRVGKLLGDVWGVVRESNQDRQAQIASYTRMLSNQNAPAGDPEHGRALFAKTCQQCHTLFGTGGNVGPDITGSNRANLEYLLSNILDPSAVMAKEYQPTVLALADGRVLTGIIKSETSQSLTLQTPTELLTISAEDVEERKQSETSMMPDDLLRNLSEGEVRSLVAYLSSSGQTAQLATPETTGQFFNGQNLAGWRPSREGEESLWSVENGELIGRSPGLKHNAFLMSELALEDFRFRCQVKLSPNSGNSGIQFRSEPFRGGEMKGYQADIGAGWWGKLYEEQGRALLVNNKVEHLVKLDDWNDYEILAVGSRVQTFLNGERVVDLNDPDGARRGVIGLQLHSGGKMEVRFRNLSVELVSQLPPYAAAGSPPGSWPSSPPLAPGQKITWKKTTLDSVFRSEGCCIADINNDGLMDIATGSVWYQNPGADGGEWKAHQVAEEIREFNPVGYGDTFMNYAEDLNGDGWLDLIVVDFPGKPTWWFANPGDPSGKNSGKVWERHEIIPETNNESPQYLDINRDGKRELVAGIQNQTMAYAYPAGHPQAPWKIQAISKPGGAPGTNKFSHGLGIGDINGDGRADVLVIQGWWEAPANPNAANWKFHKAPLGELCSQMHVFDYDGDGDADVLSSSAHKFGIWWHEQITSEEGESEWKTHLIDESFSQTHANVLADINGDGLPDFVTGMRWWAHSGRDKGEDQPPVLYWFELSREDGKPKWTKHQIDDNSGVGTQFEVADVNGDGLLDIVTSNKRGTFLFEQIRE